MSTRERDPYDVLGVARDADAGEIKKAFRRLARELHPDVNDHDPAAEEKFKDVATAYEILSDPQRRSVYDRYGHEGLRSGGQEPNFDAFGSISDLFGAFFGDAFGQRPGGPRQGDDAALALELTLEEAFRGVRREVVFEAVDRCSHCNGNGAEPGTPIETCDRCGGQGVLQAVQRTPFGQVVRQVACDRCAGDGRVAREPCAQCDGRGRTVGERRLEVQVPAGIESGQRIRLAGRGHAGERGGPPGDLYVVVQVAPDPRVVRDGDDLVTTVDVSPAHAALGTTATVDHFDGPLEVKIKAGAQPGEVVTLKGRGMPSLGRRHAGDLRVVIDVVIPRRPTREQRRLLEQLAESITSDQLERDGETVASRLRRLLGSAGR